MSAWRWFRRRLTPSGLALARRLEASRQTMTCFGQAMVGGRKDDG